VTAPADLLVPFVVVVAGLSALAAFGVAHIRHVHTVNAATAPAPDPAVWLPCHTTTCAHLTQPHDPAPTGPVCRTCGNTKDGAAT
jgi:hypothetical protein